MPKNEEYNRIPVFSNNRDMAINLCTSSLSNEMRSWRCIMVTMELQTDSMKSYRPSVNGESHALRGRIRV